MGTLAARVSHIDYISAIIKPTLHYFSKKELTKKMEKRLALAAELAFSDQLLFEKFLLWTQERDDDVFLFHINRFFEKRNQQPLSPAEKNLTSQKRKVGATLRKKVRDRQKQIFSQRLTRLATEYNLLTNDQLGEFLGVSGEQARKFKSGENKPQLTTLKKIADRFKVPVEFLLGLSNDDTSEV